MSKSKRVRKSPDLEFDVWQFAIRLLDVLDDGQRNRFLGYIRNRNVAAIVTTCDELFQPSQLLQEEAFAILQIKALFSKNRDFISPDYKEKALASFDADELHNSQTNARLRGKIPEDISITLDKAFSHVDKLLGPFETFLDSVGDGFRITSGATARLPRSKSFRYRKVRKTLRGNERLKPLIEAASRYFKIDFKLKVATANLLSVVPKNYKTGRTIACEPDGNLPFQLAFDRYAKRRLARKGQNLRDQSRNSNLARISSVDESLATIDFKSASNSLSSGLIDLMASYNLNLSKYADYLYRCRSAFYRRSRKSDVETRYQMFSSMGNGTTFVLETIVFWSLARAIGSRRVSVYGDDVIIETELAPLYIQLCKYIGFEINVEKTFTSGPFRESCGGNYYRGLDITPVYVRGKLNRPLLCHTLNSLAQRKGLMSLKAYLYLIKWVTMHGKVLPKVPFTFPSWAGLWCREDFLLTLGRLHLRSDGIWYTSGYVGFSDADHVRDIRTYLLWIIDHRTDSDTLAIEKESFLETLQSRGRRVKWSTRKQPALVGLTSSGCRGVSLCY